MKLQTLSLMALLLSTFGAFSQNSWPQFRGPWAGHVPPEAGHHLPLEWGKKNRNVKWQLELPGEGWSSPVVADGRIWLTTATEDGHSLRAICVDLASGKQLHDIEVFRVDVLPPKHKRNSYASPTGLLDGGVFYVSFGSMGVAALDAATGRKVWENREHVVDHQNGPGGSVAHHGDLILLPFDGTDKQFEVGLDKKTGKTVWRSERSARAILDLLPTDMRKAYGTPAVFQMDGKPVSVTTASNRLYALDPASGKELWHFDYVRGFSNVPMPIVEGKTLVFSTGFNKAELVAIRFTEAAGDITQSHLLWKQKAGAPDQSTPIIVDNRVYMVSSGGILSCLNLADGEILWKERIAADFAASPIHADGRIYLFSASQPCTVIKPGPTFEVLATNKLDEGCMATPAVIGSALIVRTKKSLYRIEQ